MMRRGPRTAEKRHGSSTPSRRNARWTSANALVEKNERVVEIGEVYARLLGFDSPRALCGARVSSLIAECDRERLLAYSQSRLLGVDAPARYVFHARRRDGFSFPLLAEVSTSRRSNRSVTIATSIEPTITPHDMSFTAFELVYDFSSPLLYSLLLRILRNPDEAEEVLQEIFIQAWAERASFEPQRTSTMTWLLTIARSRAVHRLRARRSRPPEESIEAEALPEDREAPDAAGDLMVTTIGSDRAKKALSRLPAVQLEVLSMAYFEGLTPVEIAAETGHSVAAVSSLLLGIRALVTEPRPDEFPAAQSPDARLRAVAELSRPIEGIEEFEALYDASSPMVFAILLRILSDTEEANDLLQEVYLEAWEKRSRYDMSRGSRIAWLLAIARSRAIDRIRARSTRRLRESTAGREVLFLSSSVEPDRGIERLLLSEQIEALRIGLAELPENQRKTLELAYFEGLSHTRIAERLDQPLGTVKTRVQLGMKKLRALVLRIIE